MPVGEDLLQVFASQNVVNKQVLGAIQDLLARVKDLEEEVHRLRQSVLAERRTS